MELYAAGFNVHRQLLPDGGDPPANDILRSFSRVLRTDSPRVKIWAALWSATVIEVDGQLMHWGYNQLFGSNEPTNIELEQGISLGDLKHVFGDLSGVLGALSTDGRMLTMQDEGSRSVLKTCRWSEDAFCAHEGMKIQHIAVADSDEVCICTLDGGGNFTLHVFSSFTALLSGKQPVKSHPMPCLVLALQASATSFTVLLAEGRSVWTFGSALRPELLARTPSISAPANAPCPVMFLGGIAIRKIVTCGWLGAALSTDRDLYIWGGEVGEGQRINALPDPSEEVRLVDIGGADILDVAVGMGHMVALTADGEVWGCGEHDYGQLALGYHASAFVENWTIIKGEWVGKAKPRSVKAGGWGSWIILDSSKNAEK